MRTLAPLHDAARIQRRSCAWRAGEASPAFRLLFPANLRRLAFGVLRQERFSWKETNGIRNHDGAAALRPAFHSGPLHRKNYLIIDEAQNLTPKQAKGIITRAGMGTKIILLGDPNQIDNPLLDERTNGLSYAAEKMKGSPLCFQLTLSAEECERSALAMDAGRRM